MTHFPPRTWCYNIFILKGSCDVENLITHTATNTQLDSLSGTFCAQRCFVRKQTRIKKSFRGVVGAFWFMSSDWQARQPFVCNNFLGRGASTGGVGRGWDLIHWFSPVMSSIMNIPSPCINNLMNLLPNNAECFICFAGFQCTCKSGRNSGRN